LLTYESYPEESAGGLLFTYDLEDNRTREIRNSNFFYDAAWSNDGRLAVVSGRAGSLDVYVMDALTGETVNVTNHSADDTDPAWSHDGRLAFVSNRDGNNEIYILDPANGVLQRVTYHDADDRAPAWMP
jgi:Tol biopolymer transport system component